MEKTGQLFNRAMAAFNGVTGANLNPELQKVQDYRSAKTGRAPRRDLSRLQIVQRVAAIYKQRDSLKLDAESLRLVEYYYKKFVHSGANLSDSDKAELKKLNEEESTLTNAFTTKLLAATKDAAFVTTDKDSARGLERCAKSPPPLWPPKNASWRATSFLCRTPPNSPIWIR